MASADGIRKIKGQNFGRAGMQTNIYMHYEETGSFETTAWSNLRPTINTPACPLWDKQQKSPLNTTWLRTQDSIFNDIFILSI